VVLPVAALPAMERDIFENHCGREAAIVIVMTTTNIMTDVGFVWFVETPACHKSTILYKGK